MPLPAYRAKQSTSTTGTGSLVLAAATATGRSLAAAFGAARRVQYVISWASGFEIGWGDYDGATPGALTRAIVLASSNGGALVSLPAGVKDVFVALMPRQAEPLVITGTATLAPADMGGLVLYGGGAAATLNLPAYATVPLGASVLVLHQGVGALTIDPAGAETINSLATLPIFPGETAEVFRTASGWTCTGLGNAWRQIAASVSGSSQSAVVLGLPASVQRFRLEMEDLAPTAAAAAFFRFSFDGGGTYAAGATDYGFAGAYLKAAGVTAMGTATTYGQLSDTAGAGSNMFGTMEFRAQGTKQYQADSIAINAGAISRLSSAGACSVAGTATHVLLGFVGQSVAAHRVRLLGIS